MEKVEFGHTWTAKPGRKVFRRFGSQGLYLCHLAGSAKIDWENPGAGWPILPLVRALGKQVDRFGTLRNISK